MPHAEANGQQLYYEIHGEGAPLLLVMGLGADRLAWALQIPEWSKHFRTVSFDNRDVGQSSYATQPYTIPDMAADALAFADALGLDVFHLVGVSMGGAIAQELALRAPQRVSTLSLCVTWGGWGPLGELLTRTWGPLVMRSSDEERIDDLMLRCFSERFFENPSAVSFMRRVMLDNPHLQSAEAFVRQLTACGAHETRDRLAELRMPVHVVGAEHDTLVPVWKSKELAELIPDSTLTILDAAPHGLNVERAEEFNRVVLEFLRSAPAARAA
ncbi:MAG: alpha/beta hydrolase [Thermoleophilaceae bacterium]